MKTLVETILSRKLHDPKVIIYKWLDEYGIKNYTLDDKGEIDVDGDVDLSYRGLKEFPSYIQFGTVKGGFECYYNNLTSLRGCPRVVKKSFYCHNNNLLSLKGSPETVDEDFDCSFNNLTTLEGAPKKVGGDFYCYNNKLTTLKGAPREVGGDFDCCDNGILFTKEDVMKVCKVKRNIILES